MKVFRVFSFWRGAQYDIVVEPPPGRLGTLNKCFALSEGVLTFRGKQWARSQR